VSAQDWSELLAHICKYRSVGDSDRVVVRISCFVPRGRQCSQAGLPDEHEVLAAGDGENRCISTHSQSCGKSGLLEPSSATSSPRGLRHLATAQGTRRAASCFSRDGCEHGAGLRSRRSPRTRPLQLVGVVAARRQSAGAGERRFGEGALRRHPSPRRSFPSMRRLGASRHDSQRRDGV
jgi:hypothetical protein